MAAEITPRVVDWLLYNRRELRALVDALEPPGASFGMVRVPVSNRACGSKVEHVAISRAAISTVLDIVDRAVAKLPRALRRIVQLRYERQLSMPAIARYVHWSERNCYRKLDIIRARVASSLSLVDGKYMADMWAGLERLLAG